ncbi:MAG: DUF87 domain-containing protein [Clostridia bacterium]|nr:DUF87 domain-containing protein [Clostridia bacterium]
MHNDMFKEAIMNDFEKLGIFYLGKEYDSKEKAIKDIPVLYKSKDLTTHAVIIGMTGSGKTGLGIDILEEAIIDHIPVIAIDPKGDIGNLCLTFPDMTKESFIPWINSHDAQSRGYSIDEYASEQAKNWKNGLEEWNQDQERVSRLRDAADITIYTPGSSAGVGVVLLKSFEAPSDLIKNDHDVYTDRIMSAVTSLLSLTGLDVDPFTSREHVLISNIFKSYWDASRGITLPELISAIQSPPFEKIGIMDTESFYPSKERFSLAMRLNNLLASPDFESWSKGEILDINKFLYNLEGKPRVSIFSISHLSDNERMFFVTMLLSEISSWVRSQPGTGSLKAILYIDEVFGYIPPTANPPSKLPLMTLLKQARASGLGVVLATQNPVDLDYKALSNTGTWFIGRLQTDRDKERVLAGLEGAAFEGSFDKQLTGNILAGLGQRMFYLHSIHKDNPTIFNTRWTLSYLAGPLTREQISALNGSKGGEKIQVSNQIDLNAQSEAYGLETPTVIMKTSSLSLPSDMKQVYFPVQDGESEQQVYTPWLMGVADVLYNNSKYKVTTSKTYKLIVPLKHEMIALDWSESKPLNIEMDQLSEIPQKEIAFADLPPSAFQPKNYTQWKKLFIQYIRTNLSLKLFANESYKVVSQPQEEERDFMIRLRDIAHEQRDEAIEKLRMKYASKMNLLEERKNRAEQTLDRQNAMASQKKVEAAVSAGTALLGALLGTKKITATSVSRMGTAVKSTGRALKSSQSIAQAQESLQAAEDKIQELTVELQEQLDAIASQFEGQDENLNSFEIRALSENIAVHLIALAWIPQSVSTSTWEVNK